ncbi:hypothetical protein DFH08DRAFT_805059 [Mycena albidolilacea]|uniref:Uncharacterized protein n=1 Tax=Mycena albidolilacea TaxID=1033008 RepID=A0AAD7EWE7_9AGAR|nr:hypothetical protein DFH08DRAFT_805059 [Mycena albidolilacea]
MADPALLLLQLRRHRRRSRRRLGGRAARDMEGGDDRGVLLDAHIVRHAVGALLRSTMARGLNSASTAIIFSLRSVKLLHSASSASHALPNTWIHPCSLFEFHFAFAVAEVGLRQKMPPRFSDQRDADRGFGGVAPLLTAGLSSTAWRERRTAGENGWNGEQDMRRVSTTSERTLVHFLALRSGSGKIRRARLELKGAAAETRRQGCRRCQELRRVATLCARVCSIARAQPPRIPSAPRRLRSLHDSRCEAVGVRQRGKAGRALSALHGANNRPKQTLCWEFDMRRGTHTEHDLRERLVHAAAETRRRGGDSEHGRDGVREGDAWPSLAAAAGAKATESRLAREHSEHNGIHVTENVVVARFGPAPTLAEIKPA